MKSIVTNDLEHCIISGSPYVAMHHCVEGTANRAISDDDGLIVPLDPKLHNEGGKQQLGERCDVHHCAKMSKLMHIIGEQAWIIDYICARYELPFEDIKEEAKEMFIGRYGKNYI